MVPDRGTVQQVSVHRSLGHNVPGYVTVTKSPATEAANRKQGLNTLAESAIDVDIPAVGIIQHNPYILDGTAYLQVFPMKANTRPAVLSWVVDLVVR